VDWVAPHAPWDDSLAFTFDGGVIAEDERASIQLLDGDLKDIPVRPTRSGRPYVGNRCREALSAANDGTTKDLHNGRPL
jgi:8-oxo-dGTP diphosphatase